MMSLALQCGWVDMAVLSYFGGCGLVAMLRLGGLIGLTPGT